MEDFIDKKEKIADLIEEYTQNKDKKEELLNLVEKYSTDDDFKNKELFTNIFNEIKKYLDELSPKELKQRILMIRSYL